MATITLNFKTDQTQRAIDRLKSQARAIAIPRALNKSIASAKTAMNRVIAKDMGMKVGDVAAKIGVESATADRHSARLSASYKKIPLIKFGANGSNPSRGRGRVTANTGGGRQAYPGAFIATMPGSDHTGVFRRMAGVAVRSRDPRTQGIRELQGPSIAQVFVKHQAVGLARAQEQLVKNLNSEFRFALQQTT